MTVVSTALRPGGCINIHSGSKIFGQWKIAEQETVMPEKRKCGIKEDSSAMLFAMFLYPNGTVTDAHRAQ